MLKDAKAVRAVPADLVEPRLLTAPHRIAEPATQVADIFCVHGTGLYRIAGEGQDRPARHRQQCFSGIRVRAADPGIGQLGLDGYPSVR